MADKLTQALAAVRQALADARLGTVNVPTTDLATEIVAAQQVMNAAAAVQTLRLAQYAAREQTQDPATGTWAEVDHPLGHVADLTGCDIGPLLAMSPRTATHRVHTAAFLASALPATLTAMGTGTLDSFRASLIADELSEATPQVCAAVEALIHPKVTTETPGRVRARTRRALARVDADAVRAKAAAARLERFVRCFPAAVPGLTDWVAALPTADSARCWAAIDALAHHTHDQDPTRTLAQCRADALVDLLCGNATITTTLNLTIGIRPTPVPTGHDHTGPCRDTGEREDGANSPLADRPPDPDAAGEDPLPQRAARDLPGLVGCEIPGIGHIPHDVLAGIAAAFDTRIRRVLLDQRTGTVIETGVATYRPNTAITRLVRLRDRTCRFPGCAQPAERCDLDHVQPWPHGPTTPANLQALCRHHHRAKHDGGWRVTMTPHGLCTWTDRTGHTYQTHPADYHELSA